MQTQSPIPATIPGSFAHALAAFADRPAIATATEELTYAGLDSLSWRYVRALVSAGVGKGSRVALLAPNGVLFVAMYLACMRVGALMTPISTLCSAAELAYALRHSDAQILFARRRFQRRDFAELLEGALPELSESRHGALRLAAAPFLRSIWFDETSEKSWAGALSDLVARGRDDATLTRAFLSEMALEVSPGDEAVAIYTSGSTGAPKAVVHSQGGVARHGRVMGDYQRLRAEHRVLPLTPLFWVGGLDFVSAVFAKGACLVFPEGASAEAAADAIGSLRVNFLYGWPAVKNPVRDVLAARQFDFSGIRGLDSSLLPPIEAAVNPLGMTESFGPHSAMPVDHVLPEGQRGASGLAVAGIERRIVDRETGEILAAGEVGELQLRGGAMMLGFYKRERREVFEPDGFYATQDLGRIDADGMFYFQGRSDDMLKSRGANVSRLEVEAVLRQSPGVAEAVVCGIPKNGVDQRVVAAIVLQPGATVTEADLIETAKAQLSSYKVPRNIVFINREELIFSATGKIRVPEMSGLIEERLRQAL